MTAFLLGCWANARAVLAWLIGHPTVLLIVILLAVAWIQTTRLHHARRDLAACHASVTTLRGQLGAQDLAIKAKAAADLQAQAVAQKVIDATAAKRGAMAAEIARLMAVKQAVRCPPVDVRSFQ